MIGKRLAHYQVKEQIGAGVGGHIEAAKILEQNRPGESPLPTWD